MTTRFSCHTEALNFEIVLNDDDDYDDGGGDDYAGDCGA